MFTGVITIITTIKCQSGDMGFVENPWKTVDLLFYLYYIEEKKKGNESPNSTLEAWADILVLLLISQAS